MKNVNERFQIYINSLTKIDQYNKIVIKHCFKHTNRG